MNVMHYKGHAARIAFDGEDRVFVGHLAGINDVIGFHAETVEGLEHAFHDAVEDYTETCARIGKPAERPYSGKVMFRISPELHARAALAAQLAGQSLNHWAEEALASAALKETAPGPQASQTSGVGPKRRGAPTTVKRVRSATARKRSIVPA